MERFILVLDVDNTAQAIDSLEEKGKVQALSTFVESEVSNPKLIEGSYVGFYLATHRSLLSTSGDKSAVSGFVKKMAKIKNNDIHKKKTYTVDYSQFDLDKIFLSQFCNEVSVVTKLPCFSVSTPGDMHYTECGQFFNEYMKPYEEAVLKTKQVIETEMDTITTYDFDVSVEFKNPIPFEDTPYHKNDQYIQIAKDAVKRFPNDQIRLVVLDDIEEILSEGLKIGREDLSPNVTLDFYQHKCREVYNSYKAKDPLEPFYYVGSNKLVVPKPMKYVCDTWESKDSPSFEKLKNMIFEKMIDEYQIYPANADDFGQTILNCLTTCYLNKDCDLEHKSITEVEDLFLKNLQMTRPSSKCFFDKPYVFSLKEKAIEKSLQPSCCACVIL